MILNEGEDTGFGEGLAQDVLEMVAVFSARGQGGRSKRNLKLLENVARAARAAKAAGPKAAGREPC